MTTIQTTEPMVTETQAWDDIVVAHGEREVTDGTARTIAGWWASPGTVGRVLASLSTTVPVDHTDLLDDIHRTRAEVKHDNDRLPLDMLATWAIARAREVEAL